MTPRLPSDLDDVLEAFAGEPDTGDAALAGYIRRYPQFAVALAEFALELRLTVAAEGQASAPDVVWLNESWRKFERAAAAAFPLPPSAAMDLFAGLTPARLAGIRRELDIPTAILNGFRDRLVLAATVPARFMGRLANALGIGFDELRAFLELPSRVNTAASYSATGTPGVADAKIGFETLLDQAMVSPDRRRALMQEDG